MTVTISIDGDQATFTFEKTAGTAIVMDTADRSARYIYPIRWQLFDEYEEPILYDDLTNAQKLAVLDKEITFHLRSMARTDWVGDAVDIAREAAEEEAEEMFDL